MFNALNLSNTLIINSLYLYRTYNMCKFDKIPVWKFADEGECTGEAHTWYYLYLILAHSYFLFEYLLKFSVQDYKYKFIFTFDSILEIITIIPFFFTLLVYGKD